MKERSDPGLRREMVVDVQMLYEFCTRQYQNGNITPKEVSLLAVPTSPRSTYNCTQPTCDDEELKLGIR